MTVIINEFEVVAEPPSGETAAAGMESAEGQSARAATGLTPADIEQFLRHLAERLARIAA